MYSNCRLLSTRARSTLTETGTGPSPLDDGGETHTISFIDRLQGDRRRVVSKGMGKRCSLWPEKGFSPVGGYGSGMLFCPFIL